MDSGLLYKEEVYSIIGAAIAVMNELGTGFQEAVYQKALEMEFSERKLEFIAQKRIPIWYKNRHLKKGYIADFHCFNSIIVEIKAVNKLTTIEEAQIINYLKATGMKLGLLINFGCRKLEWKRFANTME